jgi:hypothetical protein
MILADIFEKLLEARTVILVLPDRKTAEIPRVSLLRKFKDYKQQMAALGFLDPSLENAVVSLEWDEENKLATFYLRERKSRSVDYTLVEPADAAKV